jgi:hypothetical protein
MLDNEFIFLPGAADDIVADGSVIGAHKQSKMFGDCLIMFLSLL